MRYEFANHDIPVTVVGPDDPYLWTDDTPAEGRDALIFGSPDPSAYVVVGSLDELRAFADRLSSRIDLADPTDPQITERNLTLWIHTEQLWRDLEAALDEPKYALGRFKPWAALYPKHLDDQYDLDKAIAWARKNGIPYSEETRVHHRGTTGTVDADDYLTLNTPSDDAPIAQ